MRYSTVLISALIITGLASFTNRHKLSVTSPAFSTNEMIPAKYSCEGDEVNPPLHIHNIPAKTKSLAIIVHDPDAPVTGGFTHWVVWNIPVINDIPENFKGGQEGMNSLPKHNYQGMCPPSGKHHYIFSVYALDTKLDIDINTDKAGLENKMRGHILAEGALTGLFEKQNNATK